MGMSLFRADLFAQADGGHFKKAGSDAGFVFGMGFDSAEDDNTVGNGSEFVQMSGRACFRAAKLQSIHGGPNRHPDRFFADAEPAQQLSLAGGSGAAMATHGRDDEWFAAG